MLEWPDLAVREGKGEAGIHRRGHFLVDDTITTEMWFTISYRFYKLVGRSISKKIEKQVASLTTS